jgi:16S rRNA (guanine527-N7)-methyltransferase
MKHGNKRHQSRREASSPRHSASHPQPRPMAAHAAPGGVSWTHEQWVLALEPVLAGVGVELDESQRQRCASYMGMLAHWNKTYNLTALRDASEMLTHHLSDCLAVLPHLAQHLSVVAADGEAAGVRVLDVGSGGGLPGVLLAIARPELQVCCVDTVGKKAAFIRQVAAELRLPNLRAEHSRVEDMRTQHEIVASRAFASLADFVALTRDRLSPGGVWMAMKGKSTEAEQAALPADIEVFHVEHLQVPGLDAERCLVWMRVRT